MYFLRERDYLTGEISPYVKIGLVRADKDTATRITEHQTGNPREIIDYKTLQAPFVEYLETQLHYRFSDCWISGEWFKLDDDALASVIAEAERIITEQTTFAPVISKSYELAKFECTKEERQPNEEEKILWEKLVDKKLEIDTNSAEKAIVDIKIRMALGSFGGIEGIASVQLKKGGKNFNGNSLSQKHPDLYEEYCTKETKTLSGSFTLKGKKSLKKENSEIHERRAILPSIQLEAKDINFKKLVKRTKNITEDHAEYIELQKHSYILDWEYNCLEAQLKCANDLCRGLTGICGWNRAIREKIGFDKKAFEENHPQIYSEFLESNADSFAVIINSWRAYQLTGFEK